MNELSSKFADDKNKLIEKTLKKYCQFYGLNYEYFLDAGLLTRELRGYRELFFINDLCIFYIEKTTEKFKNSGCFGTSVTFELIEKF